jgi:hypothetical protein
MNHGLYVSVKNKSNIDILHIVFRDRKSIHFIDITMLTYNEINKYSTNLVQAPLQQAPIELPCIFHLSHFF